MSDGRTQTSQGDATKCRCGRTEFFPKDCPCQKLPPRDSRTGTSRMKERLRCYGCGRRRLVALWLDLGDWRCAALCRECAERRGE